MEKIQMKFDVINAYTRKVQFTADIECRENDLYSKKLGLAVKWAYTNKADLRSTDLSAANLEKVCLVNADLTNANLLGAKLIHTDLANADLRGVRFNGSTLAQANLRSANLEGADLSGCLLRAANLENANLRNAVLQGAILREADLNEKCLEGLEGADFEGVILDEDQAQFINRFINKKRMEKISS